MSAQCYSTEIQKSAGMYSLYNKNSAKDIKTVHTGGALLVTKI